MNVIDFEKYKEDTQIQRNRKENEDKIHTLEDVMKKMNYYYELDKYESQDVGDVVNIRIEFPITEPNGFYITSIIDDLGYFDCVRTFDDVWDDLDVLIELDTHYKMKRTKLSAE